MDKKSAATPAAPAVSPPLRKRIPGIDPPPEMRLGTIPQLEEKHKGLQGRLRGWVHRADAGDQDFAGLRLAIVRVGRSIFLDEIRFAEFLYQRSAMPPAPARRVTVTKRVPSDKQGAK